ncbi:MAG TPA: NAD(P)-binding domain-containing protein, partial [Candidatus Saccharimonadales bacterium]|nr:NAD(P)-binding domain-containing protein [Candidatus Saccharimonadales bacterium]
MPAPDVTSPKQVTVIGAGPAGLALGYELKKRKISCVILERGKAVADSWGAMPSQMRLLSPWKANRLPGSSDDGLRPNAQISRAQYFAMLQAYAQQHDLPIVTGAAVSNICQAPAGIWHIETSQGEFTSQLLVNATGYFSNPFTPIISGADATSIPQFHYATYKSADSLKAITGKTKPLVLVVGKRLSAGQAIVELVEGGCSVALSHRGVLKFGSGPLGWWIFFRIHPWLEAQKLRRHGSMARGVEIRMQGGKPTRWIKRGVVQTFPEILRFTDREVVFKNAQSLQPDAILFATGFRPALQHLASLKLSRDPG